MLSVRLGKTRCHEHVSKWNSSLNEWFLERKCLWDTVVNSIDKAARFNLRVP